MHPSQIKAAFDQGKNITQLLREQTGAAGNTERIIETAYDMQAGVYVNDMNDPAIFAHKVRYGRAIADQLSRLTDCTSLLEPGTGEGTTLSFVLDAFDKPGMAVHGMDISWSRLATCRKWLADRGHPSVQLAIASLFHLPYADASFDVVYTSHTIEPNGGNEQSILRELYRVASRHLVLLEPAYELSPPELQQRMDSLGYCKGLVAHAEALGMRVATHELLGHDDNPKNPTAITVIEKTPDAPPATPQLVCPRFGDALEDRGAELFSPGSLHVYPKVMGIPCLRPESGVIASAYDRF